jgi:hypothetical protein
MNSGRLFDHLVGAAENDELGAQPTFHTRAMGSMIPVKRLSGRKWICAVCGQKRKLAAEVRHAISFV